MQQHFTIIHKLNIHTFKFYRLIDNSIRNIFNLYRLGIVRLRSKCIESII